MPNAGISFARSTRQDASLLQSIPDGSLRHVETRHAGRRIWGADGLLNPSSWDGPVL